MNQNSDDHTDIEMIKMNVSPLSQSVVNDQDDDNGTEIWNWCISNQFPISEIISKNGNKVIIRTGAPHQGYTIHSHMWNGKLDGDATIITPTNVVIAKLRYSQGEMTGFCKLYYQSGNLFFDGYLKNGYRHGRGTEYDEQGNEIYDGLYDTGNKLNCSPFLEMGRDYWKEMDENNRFRRVFQVDYQGKYDGMCYFFENGKISRVSHWDNGIEVIAWKQFKGDATMIEYLDGVRVYEGGYLDSLEQNYPRNGAGTEYDADGETIIFKGMYKDNVRHGKGTCYKNGLPMSPKETEWIMGNLLKRVLITHILQIVLLFVVYIICLMINFYFGIIVALIVLWYLCKRWKFSNGPEKSIAPFIEDEINVKVVVDNNANKNNDDNNNNNSKSCTLTMKRIGIFLLKNSYVLTMVSITIIMIISIISYIIKGPHGISILDGRYYVPSNSGKHFLYFEISNYPKLWYIDIENFCFTNVKTFKIKHMKGLKSLSIGESSFTQIPTWYGNDESKSFHILNCESLESIEIGKYSFTDFGGDFELKNLPRLQSIQIGTIGSRSCNFLGSSFVIRGIDMILNIWIMHRSSKARIHYIR